jgi:phytoene dehydrogenase-like protein
MRSTAVTIVGGGIGGLVAALECAQAGQQVVVHEAGRQLGGRGRSLDGPYKANYGPHALYSDGPFVRWLEAQRALPPLTRPPSTGIRFRADGKLRRVPAATMSAVTRLCRDDAPADLDFRTWASARATKRAVKTAIGLLSVPTFDADPGRLSAAGAAATLRRLVFHGLSVRYVRGGWSTMIDALEARAREAGVEFHLSSFVSELPAGPVIVATSRDSAERLLGEPLPGGEGTTTAILDVGLAARPGRKAFACLDLDEHVWVARYSKVDPSLAPTGHELVSCHTGLRPGETQDEAVARIEALLDGVFAHWREDERWRRVLRVENSSGALDLPGTTWRDRPAVDRGNGIFLVGDWVAAPGLLSEVSFNSGRDAAARAASAPARAASAPARAASARAVSPSAGVVSADSATEDARELVRAGGDVGER